MKKIKNLINIFYTKKQIAIDWLFISLLITFFISISILFISKPHFILKQLNINADIKPTEELLKEISTIESQNDKLIQDLNKINNFSYQEFLQYKKLIELDPIKAYNSPLYSKFLKLGLIKPSLEYYVKNIKNKKEKSINKLNALEIHGSKEPLTVQASGHISETTNIEPLQGSAVAEHTPSQHNLEINATKFINDETIYKELEELRQKNKKILENNTNIKLKLEESKNNLSKITENIFKIKKENSFKWYDYLSILMFTISLIGIKKYHDEFYSRRFKNKLQKKH